MTKLTNVTNARRSWLLTAAVLAGMPMVLIAAPKAQAQQQIGQNGTALDANNRIGSNGVNTLRPAPSAGVLANQIITGNVSNGREFHGRLPYFDPTEFHGLQVGQTIGNFEKNSAGVPTPYTTAQTAPNSFSAYYSEARFAAPAAPGNYTTTAGGAYVPASPTFVQQNDLRLGARLDAAGVQGDLPRPGELVLPGPVDPQSNQRTIFTASALTGVHPWNSSDLGTLQHLSQYTGMTPGNVLDGMNVSHDDLARMRQEVQKASGIVSTKGPANAPDSVTGGANGQPISGAVSDPLESPTSPLISGGPVNGAVASNALGANVATSESFLNRVLGAPEKQSKQYDELKKRLERYQTDHKDAGQASADAYNKANRAKEAAANANGAEPGAPTPKPSTDGNPNKEPGAKVAPVPIKTMTQGVQANGLKELLARAEAMMKDGKFTSAIDTYSAAEQVAPNQPLIWVGRANAELGAAYYGRAEAHLKQAFKSDPALLMGQYDLRTFLGEDRLTSVIKDLREIADGDTQSTTSVFLLAYISYNTGNESRAAAYLDVADKRSGGKDPTYKTLREHWSLPPAPAATPSINK